MARHVSAGIALAMAVVVAGCGRAGGRADATAPDVPCTPMCADRECGGDGCGGVCGTCPDGVECLSGACTPGLQDAIETGDTAAPFDVESPADPGVPGDSTVLPDPAVPDAPSPDLPASDACANDCFDGAGEYPSTELLIRIAGPSGHGYFATAGSVLSLSGIVLGRFTRVTWTSPGGSGTVTTTTDSPFWQTDGIPLAPGDNLLTVTAEGEGDSVTDSVIVTSNPGLMLPNRVLMRPASMFVGQGQQVLVTLAPGPFGSVSGAALTLRQVDGTGNPLADLGAMLDDGQLARSGDEIAADGVFTLRLTIACTTPGPIFLRVAVPVKDSNGQPYSALSALARFECVPHLSPATCQSHLDTLSDARAAYVAAIAAGGSVAGARSAAIQVLRADPASAQSVDPVDGGGLWVRWNDGVLGALNVGRDGLRGGPDGDGVSVPGNPSLGGASSIASGLSSTVPIMSRDTMLLSPFADEFGSDDETLDVASLASRLACPAFRVGAYPGTAANLERFRALSGSGIVVIATHADVYFRSLGAALKKAMGWRHPGGAEVLWSGEAVNCASLLQEARECTGSKGCGPGQECILTIPAAGTAPASGTCHDTTQVDVMTGRAILGDRTWGISPAFVDYHASLAPFPSSLVHLGGCRTLYNGSMAASLFASGARAISGFSGTVSSAFAAQMARSFLAAMMEKGYTAGKAFGIGAMDPANPGSYFRLVGAKGLSVSESDILNQGFETGDVSAWTKEGDGRVITRLGETRPVDGKFMGILSTGLGYTTEVGSLEQTFCMPPGTTRMSFHWKYLSEEFADFCGDVYQDTFQVTVTDRSDKVYKVISLTVDDLCNRSECAACGGKSVGLVKSDVDFDEGNVWVTGVTEAGRKASDPQAGDWQRAEFVLPPGLTSAEPLPITLRFYATDKGDSIFDTAVLVDGLTFD